MLKRRIVCVVSLMALMAFATLPGAAQAPYGERDQLGPYSTADRPAPPQRGQVATGVPRFASKLETLPEHDEDTLLVGFKPGQTLASRANAHAAVGTFLEHTYRYIAVDVVRVAKGHDLESVMAAYAGRPEIAYVEPNYTVKALATPNDPRFDELWGMLNTGQQGGTPGADIGVETVWDTTTGSANVIVGVIDTGIDYNHPDLMANMWTNPGEVGGSPGVDDDGNGIVDDIYGANWTRGNGVPMSGDPFDDNEHGTHCAGTIGAVGNNNLGVAGVNWTVRLMGLKFLDAGGSGSTSDAISAVEYAIDKGASLTSNSWGGGGFSQALSDVIDAAGTAGQLFVAAAGNDYGNNNDANPSYPASYPLDNIISVASVTRFDTRSDFSNIGPTSVDIGAPGSEILSTTPGNNYSVFGGTSMATPHVAGAAALLLSAKPAATWQELKEWILSGAVAIPALSGQVLTGGRLNVEEALRIANGELGPVQGFSAVSTGGADTVELSWMNPSSQDFAEVILRRGDTAFPASPSDGTLVYQGTGESFTDGPLIVGEEYFYAIWAQDTSQAFSSRRTARVRVGGLLNDECQNAIVITTDVPELGNNLEATGDTTSGCAFGDTNDVWFEWTPESSGQATVNTCGFATFDTTLAVYDGCGGQQVACNDDACGFLQSSVTFSATAGQPYFIRVAGYAGDAGEFEVLATLNGGGTGPANDECDSAQEIFTDTLVFGTSVGASGADLTDCGTSDFADVWYSWTPEMDGVAVIDTCQFANFPTTLALFDACQGSQIACSASGCGDGSSLTVNVLGGVTYLIRVAGESGTGGEFDLIASLASGNVPNDLCENATPISTGVPEFGSNVGATGSYTSTCVADQGGFDTNDVWYSWTPAFTGPATVSLCSFFTFDTTLAVFDACNGTELVCGDQECGNGSEVCLNVTAGSEYLIRVAGWLNDSGEFELTASEGCFVVPDIFFVEPPAGPVDGGTAVFIYGDDLLQVTDVLFDGFPATNVTVLDNETVTCTTPPGTAGTVDVTVVAPDGSASAPLFTYTLEADWCDGNLLNNANFELGDFTGWTFESTPVGELQPWTVTTAGDGYFFNGAPIDGVYFAQNGFDGEAGLTYDLYREVTIPGDASTAVLSWSERIQWDLVSFPGSTMPREYAVTVEPAGGGTPLATLYELQLDAGTVGDTGYVSHQVDLVAEVAGIAGTTVRLHWQQYIPEDFTGPAQFDLDGICLTTNSVGTTPTLTAISPAMGPEAGGTAVTLTGTNLTGATSVAFGGAAATNVAVVSDTTVTCTSPAGTGTVDVVVTTPSGTSNAVSFMYEGGGGCSDIMPADSNSDNTLVIGEVTAYGAAWKRGDAWPVGPNPIPIGYVTRAGFLWKNGENYMDDCGEKPGGWVPTNKSVAAAIGPLQGTAVRTVTGTMVSIQVDPNAGTFAYAVEDSVPVGLTPTMIDNNGSFDAANMKVKWGPFFDDMSRTLTYSLSGPGGDYTLPGGTASFDGTDVTLTGDDMVTIPPTGPMLTSINPTAGPEAGGTAVTLTGTGLTGATAVSFGGTPATNVAVVNDTTVTCTSPAGMGAVNVTVTTPAGTSNAVTFTYQAPAAPTLTSINPTTGPEAGGTAVTLTGTNLTGVTAVSFGGTPATNVAVVNDTTVTCTSPAGTGAVNVTVTSPTGTSNAVTFTYQAPAAPTLTSINPMTGPEAGGTAVTLTGSNLTGATAVSFGGTPATSVTVVNATTVTCVSPAGTGTVGVTVTTPAGTSNAVTFTYVVPQPTLVSINPTSGPQAGGTTVTLTGTNLTGATAVSFGGTPATSVTVVNATTVTCVSPAGTGTVNVTVTTPGGTSNGISFTYVAPAPTLTAINPDNGPQAGGTTVTLTGTNLTGTTAVSFGGSPASNVVVVNATTVTCVSPAGTGTVNVTVTTPGGTSNAVTFTYNAPGTPTLTGITPNSGPAAGGTSVTLTGTNLTGATAVNFGTNVASNVVVVSDTSITCVTPGGAPGDANVTVTTPGGTSAPVTFTYIAAPTLSGIAPASGPVAGGTSVTLTGTNLTGATVVSFGGGQVTNINVVNATTITCTTPAGNPGPVNVTVTTPGGVSGAVTFTYFVAPTLSSISPESGPAAGGQTVTLTGTNLTGTTEVRFGGANASNITVLDDMRVTCTTPAGTPGPINVTLITPGGTTSAVVYTYVAMPTLTDISPQRGPTAGGTVIVLSGTALTGATAVTFGGTAALGVVVDSPTQITTVSPPGNVGTVDVMVTTPGGTAGGVQYTYIAAPVISSISPSSGLTPGGETVTITGSGFTDANAVRFGGTAANSFTVDSATQITAVTPSRSAGQVDVVVSTPGGMSNPVTFTYREPCTVSVSPTGVSIDAMGGTEDITVTASGPWTVLTSVPWLAVNPTSGDGDGTVRVEAATNDTGRERVGAVSVSCDSGTETATVTVTQGACLIEAPAGVTAQATETPGQIELAWAVVPYATRYHIYRALGSNAPFSEANIIGETTVPTFLDNEVELGVNFWSGCFGHFTMTLPTDQPSPGCWYGLENSMLGPSYTYYVTADQDEVCQSEPSPPAVAASMKESDAAGFPASDLGSLLVLLAVAAGIGLLSVGQRRRQARSQGC